MKIEQLEQLIQIAELGSMNEAAKEMYISRSSLSSSMKNLETELGKPIFVRHSKGIRLTEYGTVVLNQARAICDRVEFLRSSSEENSVQRLTIASMFCSMANDAFADLIRDYPGENIYASIEEYALEQVMHRVSDGICRIGVLTEYEENREIIKHYLEENDLEYHLLCERTLGAIVGRKNPLYYSERDEVELKELLQYPLLENYATPTDHSWVYSRTAATDIRNRIYVSDLGLALRLVADSEAVMIDTDDSHIYCKLYAHTDYRFISIKGFPKCKTGWIALRDTQLNVLEQAFIKLLEQKMLFAR